MQVCYTIFTLFILITINISNLRSPFSHIHTSRSLTLCVTKLGPLPSTPSLNQPPFCGQRPIGVAKSFICVDEVSTIRLIAVTYMAHYYFRLLFLGFSCLTISISSFYHSNHTAKNVLNAKIWDIC